MAIWEKIYRETCHVTVRRRLIGLAISHLIWISRYPCAGKLGCIFLSRWQLLVASRITHTLPLPTHRLITPAVINTHSQALNVLTLSVPYDKRRFYHLPSDCPSSGCLSPFLIIFPCYLTAMYHSHQMFLHISSLPTYDTVSTGHVSCFVGLSGCNLNIPWLMLKNEEL